MTSPKAPVVGNDNQSTCADNCACPSNDNAAPDAAPQKKRGWLRRMFGKYALCTCSGAGGFLIGHAGCVITPLVLAAVGATTVTAGTSLLALSFGAAATAGGLYAWHRLRGHSATKFEKRLVIGSALSGLLVSGALMHFGGHNHGDSHDHHQHGAPTMQTIPAEDHNPHPHMHHSANDVKISPAAAAWFAKLDTTRQREIENMAQRQNTTLAAFLNGLCITPAQPVQPPAAQIAGSGYKAGMRIQ